MMPLFQSEVKFLILQSGSTAYDCVEKITVTGKLIIMLTTMTSSPAPNIKSVPNCCRRLKVDLVSLIMTAMTQSEMDFRNRFKGREVHSRYIFTLSHANISFLGGKFEAPS